MGFCVLGSQSYLKKTLSLLKPHAFQVKTQRVQIARLRAPCCLLLSHWLGCNSRTHPRGKNGPPWLGCNSRTHIPEGRTVPQVFTTSVTALSLDFGTSTLCVLFLTRALPVAKAGAHEASPCTCLPWHMWYESANWLAWSHLAYLVQPTAEGHLAWCEGWRKKMYFCFLSLFPFPFIIFAQSVSWPEPLSVLPPSACQVTSALVSESTGLPGQQETSPRWSRK